MAVVTSTKLHYAELGLFYCVYTGRCGYRGN